MSESEDNAAKRAEKLASRNRGSCSAKEHERRVAAYLLARSCGYPMNALARKLGIESRRFYEWAWRHFPEHYVNNEGPRRRRSRDVETAPKTTILECMSCERPFPSTNRITNRMCGNCRGRASDCSPYTPDPGGSRGKHVQAKRA
jgi:hypothetical protein